MMETPLAADHGETRSAPAPLNFLAQDWPVLYLDNHLLGLYKPAGLLIQGDRSGDPCLLDLAKEWIKDRYRKPGRVYLGLVHRLDRPVAGAVLFARTSKAAGRLSDQFRRRSVHKDYLAVIHGHLPRGNDRLVHHIEKQQHRSSRIVPGKTSRSQEASLTYQVIEQTEQNSLVQVRLETGRKHQIRLQLAAMNCPILGDLRYGAPSPLPHKQIALLAWKLTVTHPTRNQTICLTSPLPGNWPWSCDSARDPAPLWNWKEFHPSRPR